MLYVYRKWKRSRIVKRLRPATEVTAANSEIIIAISTAIAAMAAFCSVFFSYLSARSSDSAVEIARFSNLEDRFIDACLELDDVAIAYTHQFAQLGFGLFPTLPGGVVRPMVRPPELVELEKSREVATEGPEATEAIVENAAEIQSGFQPRFNSQEARALYATLEDLRFLYLMIEDDPVLQSVGEPNKVIVGLYINMDLIYDTVLRRNALGSAIETRTRNTLKSDFSTNIREIFLRIENLRSSCGVVVIREEMV